MRRPPEVTAPSVSDSPSDTPGTESRKGESVHSAADAATDSLAPSGGRPRRNATAHASATASAGRPFGERKVILSQRARAASGDVALRK
jgi:hypothetical protein